ncbi:MAG: esterase [Croceicoccus sp.]|nr:esterase [Croceicoccus sp.]MAL26848.1 esterase [Croceicoccus sp.]
MAFRSILSACLAVALTSMTTAPASAQVGTEQPPVVEGAAKVRIDRITVHSDAIDGNLMGTSAERDVHVVLPPSYDQNPDRRYPVVYALHGYWVKAEQWLKEVHMPQTAEGAFANGVPEMILVFPDSWNEYNGSFYSDSPTTGDFEHFIADELIDYVDRNYRTIARPESRGLVGHSMGGYGASRIGIKHAEKYGALYLMAPCCQSPMGSRGLTAQDVQTIEAVPSVAAAQGLPGNLRSALAVAAAFSPDPDAAPLYLDLPVDAQGKEREDVIARWTANTPISFLDQHVDAVKAYRGIAIDVGDKDFLLDDVRLLHGALQAQGIDNTLDVYDGDHTNRLGFRMQEHVLPFFGRTLVQEPAQ